MSRLGCDPGDPRYCPTRVGDCSACPVALDAYGPEPTDLTERDMLKACLAEAERRVKELESELAANAVMLARQSDLAREAEVRVKQLERVVLAARAARDENYSDWTRIELENALHTLHCYGRGRDQE